MTVVLLATVDMPTQRNKSAARKLAEETGKPIKKFTPPEDVEMPDPDDLESIPADER